VHHRALLPVGRRPHRGPVTRRLLEHDIDRSPGSGQDRRTGLLMTNGPPQQPGIEPRQRTGVRRLDSGPPPHAFRPRSHPCTLQRNVVIAGYAGTREPIPDLCSRKPRTRSRSPRCPAPRRPRRGDTRSCRRARAWAKARSGLAVHAAAQGAPSSLRKPDRQRRSGRQSGCRR